MIVGRAALLVIDIQASTFLDDSASDERAIPNMAGYRDRMLKARKVIDLCRGAGIPPIFVQEVHRPDGIDFGRELDGAETEHCLEDQPGTALAVAEMGVRPSDYVVPKRRYSAFFGTDLEILLKGLKVETLLMVGGLTDVCVHYTFVDAHQHDYRARVIEDAVAGSSESAHTAALTAMEYLQTGARQSMAGLRTALSRT
ncbi:cysteine hydrolase family protein [Pseudaestuariivita sp.]|uniref:cysteine hydrolase family protein n=1 Tax=Pseudaestuariivita sp. TaxID=2211669 RepID=UPI004059C130